jgi:hypothetical protein
VSVGSVGGVVFIVIVGYVVIATAALAAGQIARDALLARLRDRTRPRPAPPTVPAPATVGLAGGRRLAAAGRYVDMIQAGVLLTVDHADDPGNGDALAVLTADPLGVLTDPDGRVLLVENAPTGHGTRTIHAIPVPPRLTDPIEAAAWTYDDEAHPVRVDPITYLRLARRT